MMDGFGVLTGQIDDKISQMKDFISAGKAETFEEYKRLCGEIKGLLTARGYILDLKQNLEESDE
jgi:hypothetical protein